MMQLRALLWLTGSHLQRLLREPMVRRALGFPIVLVGLVLGLTLLIVGVLRGPSVVADARGLDAAGRAALVDAGFVVVDVADARAAVADRQALLGVAPDAWFSAGGRDAILAEQALRRARGAPWWPEPPPLPDAAYAQRQGRGMAALILAIYTLYGVVFGAAAIARDRDQGTLEAELALPAPAWVHGASRALAAAGVLAAWMIIGITAFAAWIGVADGPALARIGAAAALAAVALGVGAIGRAGLNAGFAAALAGGLSAATALFGVGYAAPSVGAWLPIASIVAGGEGWVPLGGAVLLAGAAIALFTWRTARP